MSDEMIYQLISEMRDLKDTIKITFGNDRNSDKNKIETLTEEIGSLKRQIQSLETSVDWLKEKINRGIEDYSSITRRLENSVCGEIDMLMQNIKENTTTINKLGQFVGTCTQSVLKKFEKNELVKEDNIESNDLKA